MTDKDALYAHRLKQSEETLFEAKKMLQEGFSPRSIINRAYYSMFYAVLALFLKTNVHVKTSKHKGIISIFDKEFVKSRKLDKHYSQILHDVFDARQESDYKEFVELSHEDTDRFVKLAQEFFDGIKKVM